MNFMMNNKSIGVAIWCLLFTFLVICDSEVNGTATARDVRILRKKIRHLKALISQTKTQIKRATWYYNIFTKTTNSLSKRQDKMFKNSQLYCDNLVRSAKVFVKRQSWEMTKVLYTRTKKLNSKIRSNFKNSTHVHRVMRRALVAAVRKARKIRKERKKLPKAIGKKMKIIEIALQEQNLTDVQQTLFLANRQIQQVQFSVFEQTRSDGYSGIKQIKSHAVGGKSYWSADHKDWSFAGITDHPEQKDVLGVGHFSAVLNGVDFRSSQQTYRMEQPSYTGGYDATTSVEFPNVPPSIEKLTSVNQQITEMRNWFRDFQNGVTTKQRNIKGHFKPFLSIIEGAFVNDQPDEKMLELNRYLTGTGAATSTGYGPYTIFGFDEKKRPEYSSWKNRIITHPIYREDLTPKKFRVNSDIVSQLRYYNSYHNLKDSPAADFDLQHLDGNGREQHRPLYYTYLDAIMECIIGKENSNATLKATGIGGEAIVSANPYAKNPTSSFNAARYHRTYKVQKKDTMGISNGQRSFSDRLYLAVTNQTKVSGPKLKTKGTLKHIRSSYAIPFEVVFLTPLSTWNPYKVDYKESCSDVTGDGSIDSPFDAACPSLYFLTPQAFFSHTYQCGHLPGVQAAYFKAKNGTAVCLVESGIRTVLPLIQGQKVRVRQRYAIAPAFKDGNSAAKKLNAIEDGLSVAPDNLISKVSFLTGASNGEMTFRHKHHIRISVQQFQQLEKKKILKNIRTVEDSNGHQHIFTIAMQPNGSIKAVACDSKNPKPKRDHVCWDQHNPVFQLIAEPLKFV